MTTEPSDPKIPDFLLTLEHAKAGVANAQETIRFVDTKSGAITGLATLTTALPFVLLRWTGAGIPNWWANEIVAASQRSPWPVRAYWTVTFLALILGAGVLVFSAFGLMARSPRRAYQGFIEKFWRLTRKVRKMPIAKAERRHTILFPIFRPSDVERAAEVFGRVERGMSLEAILSEYRQQLGDLGHILDIKITANQRATSCFQVQILLYAIAVIVAGVILIV